MATRNYTKQQVTSAEDLHMAPGDEVEGVLKSKRLGVKTKFKETPLVFLELLADFAGKPDPETKGYKPQKIPKGTMVGVWVKAGMSAIMDIPEGNAVLLKCTGRKDTGKGQPMTTFEIFYDEA